MESINENILETTCDREFYDFGREISMLCPSCGTVRHFRIEMRDCRYDTLPMLKVQTRCPICNGFMYQADTGMIPTLKILQRAGIPTISHCSAMHAGHDATTRDLMPTDGWVDGPYVTIGKIPQDAIDALYERATIEDKIYSPNNEQRIEIETQRSIAKSIYDKSSEDFKIAITMQVKLQNGQRPHDDSIMNKFCEFIFDWIHWMKYDKEPLQSGPKTRGGIGACWMTWFDYEDYKKAHDNPPYKGSDNEVQY